jgi:hypothetical protein
VQFTMFCECVRFHEICSTLRILTQKRLVLIKASLAEAEVSVLRTVPSFVKYYQCSRFFVLMIDIDTKLSCTLIIEPSLAVVNVTCTVPSFVKLYCCSLKFP